MIDKNDYDIVLATAKQVAKPWFLVSCMLALLLLISVVSNIYLATLKNEIVIAQDYQYSDENINTVSK